MKAEKINSELIGLIINSFYDRGFEFDNVEYWDLIDDLNMDSITFISLVVEIEARFDIEVPDDLLLIEYFRSVDNIVKLIEDEITSKQNEGDS
jgi:acyl carrier protein